MDIHRIEKREQIVRDALAPQYMEWVLKTKGELGERMEEDAILKAVGPKDRDGIVDAGCEVGRHSLQLATNAKKSLSIDFPNDSLRILGQIRSKMVFQIFGQLRVISLNTFYLYMVTPRRSALRRLCGTLLLDDTKTGFYETTWGAMEHHGKAVMVNTICSINDDISIDTGCGVGRNFSANKKLDAPYLNTLFKIIPILFIVSEN